MVSEPRAAGPHHVVIVVMKVTVINQEDTVVHRGHWVMLVKSKS